MAYVYENAHDVHVVGTVLYTKAHSATTEELGALTNLTSSDVGKSVNILFNDASATEYTTTAELVDAFKKKVVVVSVNDVLYHPISFDPSSGKLTIAYYDTSSTSVKTTEYRTAVK